MGSYTFQETLIFFSEKLDTPLPEGNLEKESIELSLDSLLIILAPLKNGLSMTVGLGLLLRPIPEHHLMDLMTNHFLGVNTGGCFLTIDESGTQICLKAVTTSSTPPQENWDWLHRLVTVTYEWMHMLSLWEDFIPLAKVSPSSKRSNL